VSSTNRGPAVASAVLQAGGLAACLLGAIAAMTPASAQEIVGGTSTAIPSLRGTVDAITPGIDGTDAGATNAAAPALPADGGIGKPVAGADPANGAGAATAGRTRNKLAFPKGTAKTEDRLRVPRKGPPPLPQLQAYPSSLRLRGSGAAIDTVGNAIAPGPTVASLPLTPRLRTRVEDTPFEPTGYDVGSLRLTPSVTQSFGYDSNPDQDQRILRPSAFSRTEAGLGVLSTWSRNELRANLHGGYNDYFSDPQANRPDAAGVIDYRYDLDRNTALDSEARFAIDTQRIGSPEVTAGAQNRPLISTFGGSVGGSENFGRLNFALHGLLDRTAYDNATDAGGVLQDLASQNFNDYGLRMRATYEVTPVLRPFVDVLVDDRVHDRLIDYTGYRRDSTGVVGQVGSSFELTRLLSGELSAGYGARSYQDRRLRAIDDPVFNGLLTYAATPLTTLSFRAATSFDETTVAGSSGTEAQSVSLEVSHALLRNLTITGVLSYLNTNYVGVPITENTLAETLKAEYRLSRSLVATATYNHEMLKSTLVGSNFAQDVFLVGLRWQR